MKSFKSFSEGYIGAKGEKGRDYHNAGTFDKGTAYSHAKKHNGVVHKDPSGKYLVKHGKGKHVGEETVDEKNKGLWHNIHQKRKRGERPARPGEKGYPKTLDIESTDAYGKSQDAIANKKKHDAISQADRLKLAKLDALMKKQKAQKSASQNKSFKSVRNRLEATYQGKKVPLNKPMAGDVKKSKVYVDPDGDGKAQKVNFGDKNMKIKKNIPARRKSFRARHNCDNPGPKTKARYWSCKAW